MTRTALITGASRGLGRALARQLAADGWHLIIDARGADALTDVRRELAQHTSVQALVGDVRDAAHRAALATAAQASGGLDLLVNNASTLGPSPQPTLLDYPLDTLAEVYAVNVLAPLGLIQAVQGQLKPGARIINISSDAGVEAYPGWGGYGSSKAALDHLSAILAAERPDLRVYAVDPGDMNTQMHQEAFPGEDISDRPAPETSVPGLIELIGGALPSGRYQARNLPQPRQGGAQELRVALTVADYPAAVRQYRDGLGLPELSAWDRPDGRGMLLDAGHAVLELLDERQSASIDAIEAGGAQAGPLRLVFKVADLQASGDSMVDHGATVVRDPVDTPWGHRNLRLRSNADLPLTLFIERNDTDA